MDWNAASAIAPIGFVLRNRSTQRIVRTLGDAAYVLIKEWPIDDGEEYVTAVKACVDAISGKIEVEEFRHALLRAAREADIVTFSVVAFDAASGKTAELHS